MKTILVIGIGAGDPQHITQAAIAALNRVDVFFALEKGPVKDALVALRKDVCERFIEGGDYRFVEAASPPRQTKPADYAACVDALNRDKQAVFERLIAEEMADGEIAGILAWGDPSLYDSTIRNLAAIARDRSGAIDFEVIPGVSSVQVLAAKHRITLNEIGGAVEITTGRRLREGFPAADSVVVMLDSADEEAFSQYVDDDLDIYWGAYLGTEHEILIAGPLKEVAAEIVRVKRAARERHGWVFDIYLLRRRS